MRKFHSFIPFLTLFCSCSPANLFYANPEYKAKQLSGTIYVVIDKPSITYDGDMTDEFGKTNQNDSIYRFLNKYFEEQLSHLTNLTFLHGQSPERTYWREQVLEYDGRKHRSIVIKVPDQSIELPGSKPDFVLSLQEVQIFTDFETRTGQYGQELLTKYLKSDVKFLLLDNNTRKTVSCGQIRYKTKTYGINIITMHNWEETVDNLAKKIAGKGI